MEIKSTNVNSTNTVNQSNTKSQTQQDSSLKFSDELKELNKNTSDTSTKEETQDKQNIKEIKNDEQIEKTSLEENLNIEIKYNKEVDEAILSLNSIVEAINQRDVEIPEQLEASEISEPSKILEQQQIETNIPTEIEQPEVLEQDKELNTINITESKTEEINDNIIAPEIDQEEENFFTTIKKHDKAPDNDNKITKDKKNNFDDNSEENVLINNDFNIENKDIMPQMNPNMNFSGDGQPFSSFMQQEEAEKKLSSTLSNNEKDLAEEAAILSTMAENISIANAKIKKSENIKTVERNSEVIKLDTQTGITIDTVVKYDTVIMNEADVEVFTNLVQNGEVNINNLAPESAQKSVAVSKTLADMLAKSMENNQPLRIDFDNNISVIIRISRDGKISADFLPSSQVAEAYLKENLPLLRQKFDDNNIQYDELNQRQSRDRERENNRRKDRNNNE